MFSLFLLVKINEIELFSVNRFPKRISFLEYRISKLCSITQKDSKKYLVLTLACLLMFGNNYSFDNPQSLQKQLIEALQISETQFNLLYSGFSFPNIFLTLLGGIYIDHFDVRQAIIGFSGIIMVAQLIVALGGLVKNFPLMLFGRILFGLASENLLITQTAFIGKWFKGNELCSAVGFIMTLPELASAANSFITPYLYDLSDRIIYPLFFSVGLCFFSFICGITLFFIDKINDEQKQELQTQQLKSELQSKDAEKFSYSGMKNLSLTFWIIVFLCSLALGIYVPILDNANDLLQKKFKFGYISSGQLLSITYLSAAIFSLFFGPFIDFVGKRRLFIFLNFFLFAATHLMLAIFKSGEKNEYSLLSIIPLITLGICFSMYCCVLVPAIQFVVPQNLIGTALGLEGSFTNLTMTIFPIVAGQILEKSKTIEDGYSNVCIVYCGISILGMLSSIFLYIVDKQNSIVLDFINPEFSNSEALKMKEIQLNCQALDNFDRIFEFLFLKPLLSQ